MTYPVASLQDVQGAVPLFIRGIAMDAGLGIVFDGDGPLYRRDTHTMHFPKYASFSADALKVQSSAVEVQAAVDDLFKATGLHEIGHPLYTDSVPPFSDDFSHGLWNSIEDIRCDSVSQGRLAGASRIFNAGYGRLIKMGFWQPVDHTNDPQDVLAAWVVCQGRHVLAQQLSFSDLGTSAESALVQIAGQPFVDGAWQIIRKVKSATCTNDVIDITKELIAYLQLSASSPQQQKQSPQSGEGQDGDQSPGSSGSQSSGDGSSDSSPMHGSSAPSGDVGSRDNASGPDKPSGDSPSPTARHDPSQGDGASKQSTSSPGDGQSDSSAGTASDGPSHQQGSSPSTPVKGTGCKEATASDGSPAGDPSNASKGSSFASCVLNASSWTPPSISGALTAALGDITSVAVQSGAQPIEIVGHVPAKCAPAVYDCSDVRPLSMKLRNLLLAQAPVIRSLERRGSRVDSRALARVPFGQREVFLEVKRSQVVYSAVKVLLDVSPSMRSRRIAIARLAALRVLAALADIPGTKVSASAFPTRVGRRFDQVRELLPFGAQIRQYAGSFLHIEANESGGTPMAPALYSAMIDLMRYRDMRKICLALSDGATDSRGAAEAPVIAEMRRQGIFVLGIGIETMANHQLFDRFEVVNDLKDLEPAMLSLLQSSMLQRAAA